MAPSDQLGMALGACRLHLKLMQGAIQHGAMDERNVQKWLLGEKTAELAKCIAALGIATSHPANAVVIALEAVTIHGDLRSHTLACTLDLLDDQLVR